MERRVQTDSSVPQMTIVQVGLVADLRAIVRLWPIPVTPVFVTRCRIRVIGVQCRMERRVMTPSIVR